MTPDQKYLMIGADNSQVAHVYNLDTLAFKGYIVLPFGHYPRWIASSSNAILAASRVAGPVHTIDEIQFNQSTGTELPSLGVWKNSINIDTALTASPSGETIIATEADGTVMLYDATADTFVVARQDVTQLSGGLAALADDTFLVDHYVLNGSLVTTQTLETGSGSSSGYAVANGLGLRTTAPDSASPGVIQRVDFSSGTGIRPTRMTEAPLIATQGSVFIRGLITLPGSGAIVSLSTSGFMVLPSSYDATVAAPQINSIADGATQSTGVAPGGLFTITGTSLSPINAGTNQIPLPTVLGDSCMTINDVLVPLEFVSPTLVNGQIPFETAPGPSTMVLRTPAGVSNSFQFNAAEGAPAIFRTSVQGWGSQLPTVYRVKNDQIVTPSNPIHNGDWIVIYMTGLGAVAPAVNSGDASPTNPLAEALSLPVVTLNGASLPIGFAGLTPGQVGIYQINALAQGVKKSLMSAPLTITQGNSKITVSVRIVNP
jgi:uncharacterized protein (TIGR03437 family)